MNLQQGHGILFETPSHWLNSVTRTTDEHDAVRGQIVVVLVVVIVIVVLVTLAYISNEF